MNSIFWFKDNNGIETIKKDTYSCQNANLHSIHVRHGKETLSKHGNNKLNYQELCFIGKKEKSKYIVSNLFYVCSKLRTTLGTFQTWDWCDISDSYLDWKASFTFETVRKFGLIEICVLNTLLQIWFLLFGYLSLKLKLFF